MTEIIPGVYDIDLGVVHAYLYQEADRLTLIDTGLATSARPILDAIAALGRKTGDLRQIVVTHYHADHTGAAAELAERSGAHVMAHALDAPIVRGAVEEPIALISDQERPYFERAKAAVPAAPPTRVDREVIDGDELDVDGGLQVVHLPGHTAGSIAVYVPRRRMLFTGDAAARMPDGQVIVGVFNVNVQQAKASFRRLAELEFDAVFFGHGAPMEQNAALAFRRTAEKLGR